VQGELDIATTPELVSLLTRLRERRHAVVVDLADVTFIDSTGLTALMDAHFEGERSDWDFSLRRASPAVRRVVELAGVSRLLGD